MVRSVNLTANKAQAGERITEIEFEKLGLTATRREEANTQLRDIGSRELELSERRRALTEQVARSGYSCARFGHCSGAGGDHAAFGDPRPAEPLMYLIPQDRPLVIMARVPPNHIDMVFAGQEAQLVFSAFSSRTTPHLNGHVLTVSADALTDQRSQMPYYRADIDT